MIIAEGMIIDHQRSMIMTWGYEHWSLWSLIMLIHTWMCCSYYDRLLIMGDDMLIIAMNRLWSCMIKDIFMSSWLLSWTLMVWPSYDVFEFREYGGYLMEFPMIMLHWKKKKKIPQNFAKTLSALAPVSLDSLVINMMMANTARIQIQPEIQIQMRILMIMMTYWLQPLDRSISPPKAPLPRLPPELQ